MPYLAMIRIIITYLVEIITNKTKQILQKSFNTWCRYCSPFPPADGDKLPYKTQTLC